jgi:hypothetical protein
MFAGMGLLCALGQWKQSNSAVLKGEQKLPAV